MSYTPYRYPEQPDGTKLNVSLRDTEANTVPIEVSVVDTEELLREILNELRIMNLHMMVLSGNEFKMSDINERTQL